MLTLSRAQYQAPIAPGGVELKQRVISRPRWPWSQPRGAVVVTRWPRGAALIALERTGAGPPRLEAVCQDAPADPDDLADWQRLIATWVNTTGRRGAAATLALSPGDYSLLQVERPPVKPGELAAAVRWRIKEQLAFPLEEAVIDAFDIPESGRRGRAAMVYVAAARLGLLRDWTQLLQAAGLRPHRIDIAELALRNLAEIVASAEETVATLYLPPERGLIQIGRGAVVYLCRTLDYGLQALLDSGAEPPRPDPERLDRLALELQRTMDYYDSQFGLAPVKRLLLVPAHPPLDEVARHLGESLGIAAAPIALDGLVTADKRLVRSIPAPVAASPEDPAPEALPTLPAESLLALGAGLEPPGGQ